MAIVRFELIGIPFWVEKLKGRRYTAKQVYKLYSYHACIGNIMAFFGLAVARLPALGRRLHSALAVLRG